MEGATNREKDKPSNETGRKQQQSEEAMLVVKAEYIPEPREIKCMICYTTVADTEDSSPNDNEDDHPSPPLPHPKLPPIYKSLGVKVSSRMKSFYEEFKPPLCSLCLEVSQRAKAIVDQLDELEKTLNSVGEQIKEKLMSSFEDEQREREVYNDDPMEGLCNRMITVNRIREDVMKDIYKRAAKEKPGRLKKAKASGVEELNTETEDKKYHGYKQKKQQKNLHPSSKGDRNDAADDSDYVMQELTQTASGRVIKRPNFYVDPSVINHYSESESDMDEKPLEVILEEGKEYEAPSKLYDHDDDNPETPDPSWSPGHVDAGSDKEVELESSSSDSDSESLFEEENDSDSDGEILDLILPKASKKNQKPKRLRNRKPRSTRSPRKISANVPVKVVAEDGEEFEGVFKNRTVKKDVEGDVDDENAETKESVEPGAVISFSDKLMGQIRIKCSETGCGRTFSDIPRMKLHVLQKHKGIENPHPCTVCEKAFPRRSLLKLHMREHRGKVLMPTPGVKKYRACEFEGCEQKYRNRSELQIHIRKMHTHEKPFKCDHCEEGFISALKREFHVEITHHDVPPLKCEHCPRGFFRQHRLRDHIKSHTKERSYLCEICSKAFSQPAYLRYHQTQHKELELEPYKCDQCDRTFATPVNLRIHQQTQHMKEYRFHCEICNHGATHMSHLRLHMRTHSGDRPYRCDQCDKSFTRGSQLKIHIRSHTGERPYQCDSCDKNFTNSSKLRRHELTHSLDKPHKCPTCGRGFSQLTNLNSHVKSAHNKEKVNKKPVAHSGHQGHPSGHQGHQGHQGHPGHPVHQGHPGLTGHSLHSGQSSMHESSHTPVFQPHPVFGMPQHNLPELPMQFQVMNNSEGGEGTVPSYAEFIILNQQV